MADRLAAYRGGQQDLEHAHYDPYAVPYSSAPQAYAPRAGWSDQGHNAPESSFWDELTSLRGSLDHLRVLVSSISASPSDDQSRYDAQTLINRIKSRASDLEAELRNPTHGGGYDEESRSLLGAGGGTESVAVRKQQATALSAFSHQFRDVVGELQSAEARSRRKERDRLERLVRVVKPHATQEQVQQDVDVISYAPDGGQQIFQSALAGDSSMRRDEAYSVQHDAQSRAAALRNIERSLNDLAQLMRDVAIMVNQQDDLIRHIEENVVKVEKDVKSATAHIDKAKVSAIAARKKRWICFGIAGVAVIVLIIIIAVVVANNSKK